MIIFKNLRVKNFLSFGNQFTEIDLQKNKINLVTGDNGAGKSSLIVEGLTYALFGTAYRDIKKAQLINFVNNKECVVELEFIIDNNNYKIVRGQKPNILQLFKNNDLVPEASSSKDFQLYIESEVLRMNLVSFKQLVVLGTANFIPFMQLSTPQRRKLVDDLLDVSIFTKMDSINKGNIKEITQRMQENLIRISSKKQELSAYELLLKEQQSYMFSDKEIIEQEIFELKSSVKSIKTRLDELNSEKEQLFNLIGNNDIIEKVEKLKNAILILDQNIASSQNELSIIENLHRCSTCQQEIGNDHKEQIKENLRLSISNSTNKKNAVIQKIDSLSSELENHLKRQKKLDHVLFDINLNNEKFLSAISELKNLNEKLANIENKSFDTTKIDQIKNEISQLESEHAKDFNEKYCRTVLGQMLSDGGIKSVMIKKFIPIINKKINSYLKILGADYIFHLDQEFNEHIKGSGREKASYYSFSQGEKARVDLALMFTWRDIASIVSGAEINVLVLDEVFDSQTDIQGIEGIRKILEQIKSSVFIISHREQNSDDYNRHIQVKKQGRFSIIFETIND